MEKMRSVKAIAWNLIEPLCLLGGDGLNATKAVAAADLARKERDFYADLFPA